MMGLPLLAQIQTIGCPTFHSWCLKSIHESYNIHTYLSMIASNVSKCKQSRFPKLDHLGRSARIVLEQNEFSKKKVPLTGLELQILGLGLSVVLTFSPHALALC